jgi:peptidoglycan/xylan/chitin deacetylase (PgdA/CDA1 family)
MEVYVTTSWDDGHPLDFRVAELLKKYGLLGTFYVPMRAENQTMTVPQLRDLSAEFELGAHTLDHTVLTTVTATAAWQEIIDSRSWLQDTVGVACSMFCPPRGRYSAQHVGMVRRAGFAGLRSVELLSLDLPHVIDGVAIMPTTCQVFSHPATSYVRNSFKRGTCAGLRNYLRGGCPRTWDATAKLFVRLAQRNGGVFHLWGHSWELEETGQWQRLDDILQVLRDLSGPNQTVTNGQLCEWPVSDVVTAPARSMKPVPGDEAGSGLSRPS